MYTVNMTELTHFDAQGKAIMVDVSAKKESARQATATGRIVMSAECYQAVKQGTAQKGDVLSTARIAGIMAVKKTAALIPLCHTLTIEKAAVDFALCDTDCCITASCTVKTTGRTGVEMEALTGVSVALLTVYDMCKALDESMVIGDICLLKKSGGKSGDYNKPPSQDGE